MLGACWAHVGPSLGQVSHIGSFSGPNYRMWEDVQLGGKCALSFLESWLSLIGIGLNRGRLYKVQGFSTKFNMGWTMRVKIQSLFPRHVGA